MLTVTGSDGTGGSGIQADIKTCGMHGSYALSVVTAVTVQDTRAIKSTHAIPAEVIEGQLQGIIHDMNPRVAKIGMLCDEKSVDVVSRYLGGINHVVLDAAFISSRGERIASTKVVEAVCSLIAPQSRIVILKLSEAELLTGERLVNRQAMRQSALRLVKFLHTEAVIIQGTHLGGGDLGNDLLMMADGNMTMYAIPDFSQRNTHGLAGTLSASIASNLAMDNTLMEAVDKAYRFVQTLTVYSVTSGYGHTASLLGPDMTHEGKPGITPRQQELYNCLMQLISNNARLHHDVAFYADELNVSSRYLSQIVGEVAGKTTKQLIAEVLMTDAATLLATTTMSVQEVSNMLGFASQGQFAKLFRRVVEASPTDFRKK